MMLLMAVVVEGNREASDQRTAGFGCRGQEWAVGCEYKTLFSLSVVDSKVVRGSGFISQQKT
jgi:hypothetical protein